MTDRENDHEHDEDEELFEGIRVIGVEPAEDVVAPGRSVFADGPSLDEPRWREADPSPGRDLGHNVEDDVGYDDDDLDDWADMEPDDNLGATVRAPTYVSVGLDDDLDEGDDEDWAAYAEEGEEGEGHDFFTYDDTSSRPLQEFHERAAREPASEPVVGSGERDRPLALAIGVGLGVLAIVAFAVSAELTLVLVSLILGVAAAEFFVAVRRAGYQPAALLGIAATVSLSLASYWRFEAAVPLVLFLTVVFSLLWYLTGVDDEAPVLNIGITLLGVLYVGFLGSFAALMLKDRNGIGMLLCAILLTVAYDVGGLFVGRAMGRQPLSPASPNKTIEGLIGGCVAAVAVALILGIIQKPVPFADEPGGFGAMIALGVVVAVAAPIGDLCESLMKRDLGLKDMGTLLPGHGGLLDRFDSLLFVLPATYYVARLMDLFVGPR